MPESEEVYRIFTAEGSKDVTVTNASGEPGVIEFVVGEVDEVPGVNVGDSGSVDLATAEYSKLYNSDGSAASAESD